jgi:2-oxoacid dehydrogenases acyltransferase (catalytic domain)
MLHFAKKIPTVPVQRTMNLAPVVSARQRLSQRPSWSAIFLKAFSILSNELPELRRAYVALPWPHLAEFDRTTATIAVERELLGERGVLYGRISDPANRPLPEVHNRVQRYAEAPIEEVKTFKKLFQLCLLPRPLRRAAIWFGLNYSPVRAQHFGTFGLTVYSALGAESLHPMSPLATTLTYGIIDADGRVTVRLVYDHRVLDGATVARVLAKLEETLNGAIAQELLELGGTGNVKLAA